MMICIWKYSYYNDSSNQYKGVGGGKRDLDITSYVQDRFDANEEVSLFFNQEMNGEGLNTFIRTRESGNIPYLRIVLETTSETQPEPEPDYEIVTQGQSLYLGSETTTYVPGHNRTIKATVYSGILERTLALLRSNGKNSTILFDHTENEAERYAIQMKAKVINQAFEEGQLIFQAVNGDFFLPEFNFDLDAIAAEQTSHVQLPPDASPDAKENHAPTFDYIITAEANGNNVVLVEYQQ